MDGDGANVRQLTRGSNESRPAIAPDGAWFVYSVRGPEGGLFRAPVAGGASVRLAGPEQMDRAVISPDGRRVAYVAFREQRGLQRSFLEVVPAEGGTATTVGGLEGNRFEPRWTPDGRALSYVEWRGFANLWRLPLDGGPPVQLTQFESGEIFAYDWLDDGHLVLSRGAISRDVVLLRDFR
jgi:Tol biopolymer transport system component